MRHCLLHFLLLHRLWEINNRRIKVCIKISLSDDMTPLDFQDILWDILSKFTPCCGNSQWEYWVFWGPSSVLHWERKLLLILKENDRVSKRSIFPKKESSFCIWHMSCPVKAGLELGVFPSWNLSAAEPAQSKLILSQWFVYEWATSGCHSTIPPTSQRHVMDIFHNSNIHSKCF